MKQKICLLIFSITLILTGCSQSPSNKNFSPAGSTVEQNTNVQTMPKQVALMLPLSGNLAPAGNAVRNGFLAAYYASKKRGDTVPTIKVYNTNTGDIQALYNTAVSQGALFVVGPLSKDQIDALIGKTRLSVPTLVLNRASKNLGGNLYQFGLSPLDEAKQAADRARQSQASRAIVIAPNSGWGKNIAAAFINRWQTQGGKIADTLYYNPQTNLDAQIKHLMGFDNKTQTPENRRQDVDSIFLIAQPDVARQIRPLLRFYFAGNIPTYATSQIYSGNLDPVRDRDLDGVIFCDIPWSIANNSQSADLRSLQNNIRTVWPNAYSQNARLYALGVDAYYLMGKLTRMTNGRLGVRGATGTLYLDEDQAIYRQLPWSKMQEGQPVPVS